MKSLEEIFADNRDVLSILSDLKHCIKTNESWDKLQEAFDPNLHPIIKDPSLRPDTKTKNGKTEKPAKISYAAEKIATRRMTQMTCSIPIKRVYNYGDNEQLKAFADAIEGVYKSARIDGVNAKRLYAYFASCEVATFWWGAVGDEPHNKYGFPTEVRFRCRSYSPMPNKYSGITQATIWPLFNDDEDLICLSVEYVETVGDKQYNRFDAYTAQKCYYFKEGDNGWEKNVVDNPIGKIPGVYMSRPLPIYEDIQEFRDDIEFTISRNSDSIRKNSNPILKLSGKIKGEPPVGDSAREVIRLEEGGDVGLISPALVTADANAHVNMLRLLMEETLQLPNLSMENIKGLGAISGESRKTLLTDAHLKVKNESHEIIWFLDREFSIIKSYVASIYTQWKSHVDQLECTHEITPFVQGDAAAEIDKYTKACGKPVMSRTTAIEKLGMVDDPEEEISRIKEEEQAENMMSQMANLFSGAE